MALESFLILKFEDYVFPRTIIAEGYLISVEINVFLEQVTNVREIARDPTTRVHA
jgi:hypothetical protein